MVDTNKPETEVAETVDLFLDIQTFEQITEMDDEGSDEFSRAIVEGFMEQAQQTFGKMDKFIQEKNLEELSSLGHFLKGSSATLGLIHVKDCCELIQNRGLVDATIEASKKKEDEEKRLEDIQVTLDKMRKEYDRAEKYFKAVYPNADEEPKDSKSSKETPT